MDRKIYMIMPDATYPFDLVKFHTYIQSLHTSGYIKGWWHYLPGSLYFLDSTLDVNQLYNLFIKHMPLRHLIIMEVNYKNQQGWLPKEAWDWFNEQRNQS